jgi:hypothetical protein
MKKFFTLPSFGVRSLKIKAVCIMGFVLIQINWAIAQNCNYSNPVPPNFGICASGGGTVRAVFFTNILL